MGGVSGATTADPTLVSAGETARRRPRAALRDAAATTLIREAYEARDAELSSKAHRARACAAAPELHASTEAGEVIKSLVYGGLDGIITTFAIVAAVAGAGLETRTVVLMGAANLVADGLSMGLGDYVSELAEQRFAKHEYEREQWEMANFPEGEIQEMIDIYVRRKGFSRDDAERVMRTMAKYPDAFVRMMCVDELGIIAPDGDEFPAWKKGLVTMLAFIAFGAVPVLVYVVLAESGVRDASKFYLSAVATAVTMFCLGLTKASFTRQPKLQSGCVMLLNGSAAALAAFGIGAVLESSYASG